MNRIFTTSCVTAAILATTLAGSALILVGVVLVVRGKR